MDTVRQVGVEQHLRLGSDDPDGWTTLKSNRDSVQCNHGTEMGKLRCLGCAADQRINHQILCGRPRLGKESQASDWVPKILPRRPRGHRARGFTFGLRLLEFQRSAEEASCRRRYRRCAGAPLVDRHDAVTGRFVFVLPEPCLLPPNTPETGDYFFMRCCCRLSTQITGSYRFSPPHLHA